MLRGARASRRWLPVLFLGPTMAVLALGVLFPMVQALRLSLYDSSLVGRQEVFVGLGNYTDLLADRRFWNSLSVSVRYTIGVTAGSLVVGFVFAMLLNGRLAGRAALRSAFLLPWAAPLVTATLIWNWLLDRQFGLVNSMLAGAVPGAQNPDWLNDPSLALLTVTLLQIWRLAPIATIMYLAGLQSVQPELIDAARIDGAGRMQVIRHVILPALRGVTTILVLLLVIWSFGRAFTMIFLLTGGGPIGTTENLTLLTYLEAFMRLEFGDASALAAVVLLISSAFSVAFLLYTRRRDA